VDEFIYGMSVESASIGQHIVEMLQTASRLEQEDKDAPEAVYALRCDNSLTRGEFVQLLEDQNRSLPSDKQADRPEVNLDNISKETVDNAAHDHLSYCVYRGTAYPLWMELARVADEFYYVGRTANFTRRMAEQFVSDNHQADAFLLFEPRSPSDLRWSDESIQEEKQVAESLIQISSESERITTEQVDSFAIYR